MKSILINTILVRSGQMTHIWDLVTQLKARGYEINVAIYVNDKSHNKHNITYSDIHTLTAPFGDTPILLYGQKEELIHYSNLKNIQLIHAHSSLTFPHAYAVSRQLSIPLVLTLHGVMPWMKWYPRTIEQASQIIAVGPAQAQEIMHKFSKKTHIISNGIDTAKYHPDPELGNRWHEEDNFKKPHSLNVIWFGRTHGSSSRGVEALDAAIKLLRNQGFHIEARLVGVSSGSSVSEFETFGWIEDPIEHLRWGHVAYGHGRALREAMACGNVGILLGHGYGGIVQQSWYANKAHTVLSAIPQYDLPYPDPETIAYDLASLYNDDKLIWELRKKARKIAEHYFDLYAMVNRTVEVYHEAIEARTEKVSFRLSAEDKNYLLYKAAEYKMTTSDFLVKLIKDDKQSSNNQA